jgi:hypothetical protein
MKLAHNCATRGTEFSFPAYECGNANITKVAFRVSKKEQGQALCGAARAAAGA